MFSMEFLVGLAIGLAIGWNVLPQPEFIKVLMDAIVKKTKGENTATTQVATDSTNKDTSNNT